MIHIEFDPEKRPELLTEGQKKWFEQWKQRAQQATDRVVMAWEAWRLGQKTPESLTDAQRDWLKKWDASPHKKRLKTTRDGKFKYEFEEDIWSDMKNWLLANFFHFKCAYCEQSLKTQPRHAEHFRPKAQVKRGKRKAHVKDDNDQETAHPGYFWLAYHWQNLLPSCTFCNTINGKKDKFPVLNDYASMMRQLAAEVFNHLQQRIIRSQNFDEVYYLQPSDLDLIEGRALLHPCLDDPQKYLTFNELGIAVALGDGKEKEIAEFSIETYNLNGDIVTARREAQFKAKAFYNKAISFRREADVEGKDDKAIKEIAKNDTLARYIRPQEPYSAAILAGLKHYDPEIFS